MEPGAPGLSNERSRIYWPTRLSEGCAFCAKAKKLLNEAGVVYADVNLPHTIRTRALGAIAKAKTVPQLFVNGELIGGLEELERWARKAA